MSKELAQTVGGKKIAWLLAILAAIAVFAAVAQQRESASALTAADLCLDETVGQPPVVGDNAPECIDNVFAPATVTIGDVIWFKVSTPATGITLGTTGQMQFAVSLDPDLTINNNSWQNFGSAGGVTCALSATVYNTPGVVWNVAGQNQVPAGTSPAGLLCTWNAASLSNNATGVVFFSATVTGAPGSAITATNNYIGINDTGTASTDVFSTNAPPPNLTNTVAAVVQGSHLVVTKTCNAAANCNVVAGQPVTYTITITNPIGAGVVASSPITLTDTLPAGLSGAATATPNCAIAAGVLTCGPGGAFASLAPGGSIVITVTGTANLAGGTLNNTASAAAANSTPNPATGSSTGVVQTPTLAVTKTISSTTAGTTGATYTITLNNTGLGAANGISVNDAVPAAFTVTSVTPAPGGGTCTAVGQLISCANITVPAGGNVVITVTGNISTTVGASLTNTAVASGGNLTAPVQGTFTGVVGGVAAAIPVLCPGLYHLDPNGNLLVGPLTPDGAGGFCYPSFTRDVPNNVITANHTVCLVDADARGQSIGPVTTVDPPSPTATVRFRISTINGTSNVQGQIVAPRRLNLAPIQPGGTPPPMNGLTPPIANIPVFAGAYVFPLSIIPPAGAEWTAVTNGGGASTVPGTYPTSGPLGPNQIIVTTPGLPGAGGTDTLDCVTWYSTGSGEQNVTVVDPLGNVVADWADGPTVNGVDVLFGGISAYTPLVKEWNTLTYTEIYDITSTLISPTLVTNSTTLTGSITQNSGTGLLSGTSATFGEYVWGTHQNATGTFNALMIGARVTFTRTGNCGAFSLTAISTAPAGPFYNFNTATGTGGTTNIWTSQTGSITVTSTGVPIPFTLNAGQALPANDPNHCTSTTGSTTGISITVSYPNATGSVTPVLPPETLLLTWQFAQPFKQIFLAWAGQRVMLEHDWRFPPGDAALFATRTGQVCGLPGGNTINRVTYVKGSGPGNFVPGVEASINGSDQAWVTVSTSLSQIGDSSATPKRPQDACISRVIYESEDMGQVDIEAFGSDIFTNPPASNATQTDKIAFVIYYMKLEEVKLGLVTQVSKPTHNSTESDYAPGNPWDITKDAKDATADWNVSKDLLVRGVIKGWFTTSNPSGRTAGTDSNGGALPAGRWVMPDDWPLLFGGPADPADGTDARGIAENFRPAYDYMIAPNNTSGRSFNNPDGLGADSQAVTLAAAISDTQTTITVSSATSIFAGGCIRIEDEWVIVTAKSGNTLTVTRLIPPVSQATLDAVFACAGSGQVPVVAYAHPAGARISLPSGVPFEGPFSLLDLASLSQLSLHTTTGGAAESNYVIGEIRDTIWGDGDIDKWDAPMPPAAVIADIRGSGFIKQVDKASVYYLGTPNKNSVVFGGDQTFTNPYYITNIPESPYLPASVAGGGYYWDSWGNDGPGGNGQGVYRFWTAVPAYVAAAPGRNPAGITDTTVTTAEIAELNNIRLLYGCLFPQFGITEPCTISRTLVLYSDNHGEFMFTANGDFKLTYDACAANALGGGKHCKPGDKVGASTITAVVDYPDFKGKHYPLGSNQAKVNWTWGGYKSVSVEKGETDQYKYIVFHALDRDGFCTNSATLLGLDYSPVLLHPVLTAIDGGSAVTSLTGVLNASTTNGTSQITVADASGFAVGQLVRIENEWVIITAINGNTIDVVRGQYGSSAIVHPIGAIVFTGIIQPIGQLTAALVNGGDLLLTVTTSAGLAVGDTIRVDNELMVVTGLTPTSITVSRGANGSVPGAHLAGAYVLRSSRLGPIELVDFLIDSGEGIILNTSGGGFIDSGKQFASSVPTYSTLAVPSTFKKFPLSSLAASGAKDECQAYIRVSNSLLSVVNVLTVAHDDEGDIGFDNVIDLTNTTSYTLAFRWSLITFDGADGISPTDALKATGKNTGGTNIYDKVTAVYGWNQASQTWLGFFPSGVGVPGANDLTALKTGQAYWIAITGPDSVTWTVVTNVN